MVFQGEKEDQVCSEYIELFFQHLLTIPEVRGFELVEKFLEFSDRRDFLKHLNTLYGSAREQDIREMYHKEGTVGTAVTGTLMTFAKNAAAFAKQDLECLDE